MQTILTFLINMFLVLYALFSPSLTVDTAQPAGEKTGGATGFLYGVAEPDVPSKEITDALHITSMSAKTAGGRQHPVGDVSHIAPQIASDDMQYLIVYLQDMYSTWYYDEAAITEQKKNGTYDWKTYLETVYYPLVDEALERYRGCDYFDKLVFCPFNESDNAVWFGTWMDGWNAFDEQGRQNFYEAYAQTVARIRSVFPDARFAGPAYCGFDETTMGEFLAFTKAHDCVPDVIVYHELNGRSIFDWNTHVDKLHEIERSLGIDEQTPVVVNEYGMMEENGDPNAVAKYISVIEQSGVYGDQAYWLLANNLSNTCADQNTPNSAWWVYRWYAQMGKNRLASMRCTCAAANDNQNDIRVLLNGRDSAQTVRFTHLDKTALKNKMLRVEVQKVTYQGLGGCVYAPEVLQSYTARAALGRLNVKIKDADPNAAYLITLSDDAAVTPLPVSESRLTRFEFERGTLYGTAYTYDSAYATTGDTWGMTGGFEHEGDGVSLPFKVDKAGLYDLTLIYGKDKDGLRDTQRKDAAVLMQLDGLKKTILLPNTVRSENTGTYRIQAQLSAGSHTLTLSHKDGTYVLDSLLVRRHSDNAPVYFEPDARTPGCFLVVAPADGYYCCDEDVLFLKSGVNVLNRPMLTRVTADNRHPADENLVSNLTPFGGAATATDQKGVTYYDSFGENAGLQLTVNAPTDGDYVLLLTYASGRENGVHAYNIDLVEDFVTLKVGGEKRGNYYCRNTMSFTQYTTLAIPVTLQSGSNTITLTNDSENAWDGVGFAPRISQVVCCPAALQN